MSTKRKVIITIRNMPTVVPSAEPTSPRALRAAIMVSSGMPTNPTAVMSGHVALTLAQPAPPAAKSLYGSYASVAQPHIEATAMPMMIAPFWPRAIRTAVKMRQTIEISPPWSRPKPSVCAMLTSVAGSSMIQPISLRPMIARNMPIPAPVAIFRSVGMELIICDLHPPITGIWGIDIARNRSPSTKTAASATSHGMPIPRTTANVKYAFSPIPGARAKGRFAQSPMTMQPTNAATAVANSASPKGMPVAPKLLSMEGLTTRM